VGRKTVLSGRYTRKASDYLKKRAADRNDPRSVFYQAMIDNDAYEGYLKSVGEKEVYPLSLGGGKIAITGRGEMVWTRRKGRIEDAAK
jgi:hypothetical protein